MAIWLQLVFLRLFTIFCFLTLRLFLVSMNENWTYSTWHILVKDARVKAAITIGDNGSQL